MWKNTIILNTFIIQTYQTQSQWNSFSLLKNKVLIIRFYLSWKILMFPMIRFWKFTKAQLSKIKSILETLQLNLEDFSLDEARVMWARFLKKAMLTPRKQEMSKKSSYKKIASGQTTKKISVDMSPRKFLENLLEITITIKLSRSVLLKTPTTRVWWFFMPQKLSESQDQVIYLP